MEWVEATSATYTDADGAIDHGNIDTFTSTDGGYELTGDWGHVVVRGGRYALTLAVGDR